MAVEECPRYLGRQVATYQPDARAKTKGAVDSLRDLILQSEKTYLFHSSLTSSAQYQSRTVLPGNIDILPKGAIKRKSSNWEVVPSLHGVPALGRDRYFPPPLPFDFVVWVVGPLIISKLATLVRGGCVSASRLCTYIYQPPWKPAIPNGRWRISTRPRSLVAFLAAGKASPILVPMTR